MKLEHEDDIIMSDATTDMSLGEDSNLLGGMDDNYLGGDYFGGGEETPLSKYSDLIKQLTNFDPYLRNCINGWLGLVWNEKLEKYTRNPLVKPIMNVHGAQWCIDFIRTYTRDNNILTDISHDDYNNLYEDIIRVVWLNLGTKMEDFDINDSGDMWRICIQLTHASILTLMGAGDGKYTKFLGSVTHRSENMSITPQPQSQTPMIAGYPIPQNIIQQPQKKIGTIARIKNLVMGAR